MVRVWVEGKTVWSPLLHTSHIWALWSGGTLLLYFTLLLGGGNNAFDVLHYWLIEWKKTTTLYYRCDLMVDGRRRTANMTTFSLPRSLPRMSHCCLGLSVTCNNSIFTVSCVQKYIGLILHIEIKINGVFGFIVFLCSCALYFSFFMFATTFYGE